MKLVMKTEPELPTGEEKKQMVKSMFDDIASTYETTNRFISLGLDRYARRIALKELRAPIGSTVFDLASGTGDLSRMIKAAHMVPISIDLSFGMLENAHGSENRIQCDGTQMPLASNSSDGIICGYGLRNFVDLDSLFVEAMRVLKVGSRFVAVDVSVPNNRILKLFNRLWLANIAPKIGSFISKNKSAYEYLPRSTAYLPVHNELKTMLENVGAENINITPIFGGSLILICATKSHKANKIGSES